MPIPLPSRLAASRPARRQHGVVLFVALIAMVVLTIAGLGLLRTVDPGATAAANIAFRQATVGLANMAIETARNNVFTGLVNTNADDAAHNYYAELQAGELATGVPAALAGTYTVMKSAYPFGTVTDATTNFEVRHVVERICTGPGPVDVSFCDVIPPKISDAGTLPKLPNSIPIPPIPNWRITARVDSPTTNTTTIVQAFLQ
jgi:type IV pilus assembly protein PilX